MNRLVAVTPLLALFACDLSSPCAQPDDCVGSLVIDLSGDAPEFAIDGLGQVIPDRLDVSPNGTCYGADGAAWELASIPDDALPVTYGRVPDGARVEALDKPLVPGTRYAVNFSKQDGPRTAAAAISWSGFFVFGDATSFRTWDEACGEP